MHAGPDNTCVFRRNMESANKTLYIELVNEQDEKIRPSYIIHLEDEKGRFYGGVCSSISESEGQKNVYLSTMAIQKDMYKYAGTDLLRFALNSWYKEGVSKINLGTQTAERFYKKNGFYTTHHVLEDLRIRIDSVGNKIFENLVMMEFDLKNK